MVREAKDFLQPRLANPNYTKWLLDAIRKIKNQKQRPNLERICNAVRQFHNVTRETVEQHLESCVKEGTVLKVYNKGLCSYKDPKRISQLKSRTLKVGKGSDLVSLIVRSVKELGEVGGSHLKSIENYICRSYNVDLLDGVNLNQQLRLWVKKGIKSGHLCQDGRLIKVCYTSVESDSVEGSSEGGSVVTPTARSQPDDDEISSVPTDNSATFAARAGKVSIRQQHHLFLYFLSLFHKITNTLLGVKYTTNYSTHTYRK